MVKEFEKNVAGNAPHYELSARARMVVMPHPDHIVVVSYLGKLFCIIVAKAVKHLPGIAFASGGSLEDFQKEFCKNFKPEHIFADFSKFDAS